jgi:broad specificity phosphatase PhoE
MGKLILIFLPFFFACTFGKTEKGNSQKSTMEEKLAGTQDVTTYYFIRHAEKQTTNPNEKDPDLTEHGIRRSENWALVFKDVPFDMIYSSNYRRTKSTAKRIADAQNKEIKLYDAGKLNDLDFQEKTKGKTVLVVGHSNTNPAFVNYILKENKYSDIPDHESGSLFIVNVLPDGTKTSELIYVN